MSDNTLASEFSWDEQVATGTTEFKRGRKLERIKFKVGPAVRLLLLDPNPIAVVQHYKKDFGYIRCLVSTGQRCPACDAGDRPTQKFGINILVYPMGAEKPADVNSANVEIKAWLFNAKVFNDLKNIKSEWGNLSGYDLKVSCTKEQFQEVTVTPCSGSLFPQSPDAANLSAKIQTDAFDLKWNLGRAFTIEQVEGIWTGKMSKDEIFTKKAQDTTSYAASGNVSQPATPQKLNFDSLLGGKRK